ncbi:ScyD/ScyE family protein [Nocardioides sp. zg-DK7169]|uniref:ScyD/ScyE family protein n=1 Tax=Nocardioides sp. zg-DK7169 TaxID=2736600 RepID=UPI001554F5DC|nr:ScyD/ScyE family protein [Nocardioides sp. zg-DK7169]NPC97457.1 ScyD/ScyE family protein [Nocardioides sp. zg-DK7169]
MHQHRSPSTRTVVAALAAAALASTTLFSGPAASAGGGPGHGHHEHHSHPGHKHGHGHHGHKHGHGHHKPAPYLRTVADLEGPRGVAGLGRGRTLVTEGDGTFSIVVTKGRRTRVTELGTVPGAAGVAPAVAVGTDGTVYLLSGAGEPGTGGATLYTWRPGDDEPTALADIAAYQAEDPDPSNVEGVPEESNPYGLAAHPDGGVLVADAAGNDVLHVTDEGDISTVAEVLPRTIAVPEGFPATDPDGNPLPPPGTEIPSEAVTTSVDVGPDGAIYIGELRGFPATPGTSQVWRVEPGATGVTCDPMSPDTGDCTVEADGLTSIVDLAVDRRGTIYVATLSKASWLAFELGLEGADVGGLFMITHPRSGGTQVRELVRDQLTLTSGVDVGPDGRVLVTSPIFGPGSLSELVWAKAKRSTKHHHRR